MATLSPPQSPPLGVEAASRLRDMKAKALRAFRTMESSHAYSSPLFLRRFLELQLPELPYDPDPGCSSHTMLLLPDQTYENAEQSFLSILCAECRYHFHVKTYRACTRSLESSKHPSHMLIPVPTDSKGCNRGTENAEFICAVESCLYTVKISMMPPKLSASQIAMLQDDNRIRRNLQLARKEDPQRYLDIPDTWGAGSTVPTLARYIEDRLAKPSGDPLKIKKRNKRFCVSFGKDFDDLLRSLGFEERTDEEGEECWYITEVNGVNGVNGFSSLVNSRKAYLQDTLEELRTFLPGSNTTPAWSKLMDAFPGYSPRREAALVASSTMAISENDLILLGCLKEFSPQWFSWAAILLANICPSRRDTFLDAGLRCIQERGEEASLNIIMYKSEFDQMDSLDPTVRAAYEFFGASPKDDEGHILSQYDMMIDTDVTEDFKQQAFDNLNVIMKYLGVEQSDVTRDSVSNSSPPAGSNNRRMSIGSATRLLKVDASFTAEMIREFAANVEEKVDRRKVVEALEVLGDLKLQQDQHSEAQSLKEAADFLRATQNVVTGQIDSLKAEQPLTADPTTAFTTPPGLKNIGNTCYLNSLLQYFYNVKPVREMVLNYDQIQLGLENASIDNRRTGGNGTRVTLEEAIVARQFVEELRRLFVDLQTTKGAAASPSQKLANTALSSAKDILTSQDRNQPPPLPARPSPVPPVSPNKQLAAVNITVEPISEGHDIASSGSSQTLVNEIDDTVAEVSVKEPNGNFTHVSTGLVRELSPEDRALSDTVEHVEDIAMEEPLVPLSLEQTISQVSLRLEQSDRSGTSQQDVEEIIGNILEHLMRAIRPDGPMGGKPDLQADSITELFFTTIVNSTIKTMAGNAVPSHTSSIDEDILNEEVVPERWITAFPHPDKEHKMKNNLYEALDRYFSYELLSEGGLARYTSVRALPPIVHICIQRSDASGVKNKNPVIIPEELYLDRYMEAAAGSSLWNTRRRVWAIKERIKELELRKLSSVENVFKPRGSHAWNAYAATNASEEQFSECQDPIDLTSELWRDIPLQSQRPPEATPLSQSTESILPKKRSISYDAETVNVDFTGALWEAGKRADEMASAELLNLHEEEAGAFDSMKQHKFCLHAMICHGGGMNAGHYWVWVRDFKNQVWYKYNDSIVTKDSRDSQQVIDELNNSGDPYYVAYVQDELKDGLVDVPQRAQRGDGDVLMVDVPEEEELEVIDSIAVDTPPQPANSPVNAPLSETVMGDAPSLDLRG
ncbi:hypothetical protein GQX73_g5360 [Xylaria multiplex]|uniref:ubiquitinyl hydrolase 1 n=1 Tax=Xylaria multiplex TaxID=323545 RepID=A0A7C8IUE7_9PEZI|nr:hypothetical protein GQX73_g5360 [Xylaria multiplex]